LTHSVQSYTLYCVKVCELVENIVRQCHSNATIVECNHCHLFYAWPQSSVVNIATKGSSSAYYNLS